MARFPNTFSDSVPVVPEIGERGNAALKRLAEKGFEVSAGISSIDTGDVAAIGSQEHIREYCPKDATTARFGSPTESSVESTEKWLDKNGGRGMFLLRTIRGLIIVGYGWTGIGSDADQKYLPDHQITSAYRIGKLGLGRGLSKDFTQVVVSATKAMYLDEGEGVGLETWKSNVVPADNVYPAVGFELVAEVPGERPTLLDPREHLRVTSDGRIRDVRKYMTYPMDLLAS